jgi:hypothetical protein
MCGASVATSVTIYRSWPRTSPGCPRCDQALHQARVAVGLRTRRITDPEELDRLDRARGSSVRTVRGGLPTLGRDR